MIITMQYISEPPEVLGGKIAAALVGTFLGIFLAYGFVGPMGKSLKLSQNPKQNTTSASRPGCLPI